MTLPLIIGSRWTRVWCLLSASSLTMSLTAVGQAPDATPTASHKLTMRTSTFIELEGAAFAQEGIVGIGDASVLYTYEQSGNARPYSYSAYGQLLRGFNAISELKRGTVRRFDAELRPVSSFELPVPPSGKSDCGLLFGVGSALVWSHVVSTAAKGAYALHLDRFSQAGELLASEVIDTFPAKHYSNLTTRTARSGNERYVAHLAATAGGGAWSMASTGKPAGLLVSVFDTAAQLVHRLDFDLGVEAGEIELFDFAVGDDATAYVLARYLDGPSGRKKKSDVEPIIRVYEFDPGEAEPAVHDVHTEDGYLTTGALSVQPDGELSVVGLWGEDAGRDGYPSEYTGYYVGHMQAGSVSLERFDQEILRELFPDAKVKSGEVLHLGTAYDIADVLTLTNGDVVLALEGFGSYTTSSGKTAGFFTTDALLVRVNAEAEVVSYEVVRKRQVANPRFAEYFGVKLIECGGYAGIAYAKAARRKGGSKENGGDIKNSRLAFATKFDGSRAPVHLQRRPREVQDRMMPKPNEAATLSPGEAAFVLRPPGGKGKHPQFQISRTSCAVAEAPQ